MSQSNRADLSKEGSNQPISDSGSESVAAGADLHGHYFGHVDPGDGTEGEGEDYGDEEEESYACDRETVGFPVGVLRVHNSFAD